MATELCFKCSRVEETCTCLNIYKKQLAIKIAKAKAYKDIEKVIAILKTLK